MYVAPSVFAPHPLFSSLKNRENEIVQKIAVQTLGELALSIAIGAVCSTFVATPAGISFIAIGLVVQTIVNLAIRILVGYAEYQAAEDPDYEPPELVRWLAPTVFAAATLSNGQTVIHEAGHALAANALLKNGNASIHLLPYLGGYTTFSPRSLSELGHKVGAENVMTLVSAAGPALTLSLSSVGLATGLALENEAPEISRMLIVAALIDFLTHAVYALSALVSDPANFSHDFVSLWTAGLHPVTATVIIVAIPTLILLGNNRIRSKRAGPCPLATSESCSFF
jgi:hypothetical protein